jgi:hypothetical protein
MNFPPPCLPPLRSGYVPPASRQTRHSVTNPAGNHLSLAGNCSDERSQLWRPRPDTYSCNDTSGSETRCRPAGAIMPNSPRWPRSALVSMVRGRTRRSRVRDAPRQLFGRLTASQIASCVGRVSLASTDGSSPVASYLDDRARHSMPFSRGVHSINATMRRLRA